MLRLLDLPSQVLLSLPRRFPGGHKQMYPVGAFVQPWEQSLLLHGSNRASINIHFVYISLTVVNDMSNHFVYISLTVVNVVVNQCEEVEQLEKQYKSREMDNKVKELTSKNTNKKQVDA